MGLANDNIHRPGWASGIPIYQQHLPAYSALGIVGLVAEG